MEYKGYFKYQDEITPIVMHNDGEELSFQMHSVEFKGTEFSGFMLQGKISDELKNKYDFVQYTNNGNIIYELCNCAFEVSIPQTIINSKTHEETVIQLKVDYLLGAERPRPRGGLDKEEISLSFELNGILYSAKSDYFENVLLQVEEQLKGNYHFKNCFGCLYSDYSIYGQSAFGTMMCYVNNKEKYLSASSKAEYGDLTEYVYVQETNLCSRFQKRAKDTGYRG